MVQGVGGNNSGSISDMPEYQIYYQLYQTYVQKTGSSLSFDSWLKMNGYMSYFTQKLEEVVEAAEGRSDDKKGNTLNTNGYISNGSSVMFQSEDDESYYEFDYTNGTYTKYTGTQEAAQALGLGEQDIDVLDFGRNTAVVKNYVFGNLEDGQDTTNYKVSGKYGGVTYSNIEFDIDYILDALLMDPSDPQYVIAKGIFDELCANAVQWLPQSDMDALNETAAKYGTNSAEYKAKLKSVLLKNLDQANEWIEGHSRVKNANTAALDALSGTNNASSTGNTNNEADSSKPAYDKTNVLTSAGLSTAYGRGDKRTVESTNNSESRRRRELEAMMDQDLASLANALLSNLGDEATDEIKTYINKAVQAVAAKTELITTDSKHHGFLGLHIKTLGEYSIKAVIDAFFAEFDSLCTNKGKTTAEAAAEKKANEEKKKQEESGHKTLYNMNFKSVAGNTSNITVNDAQSAADIKAKAQTDVLNPLIAKIKSQMSGKGIPDADLDAMLSNASTAALADTTAWATSSKNSVYTINSEKLIDLFQTNVRTIIKNKGYSF